MYVRSFVTIVLLALCALSTVLARPPLPTNDFEFKSPKQNDVYRVGKKFDVAIKINGGVNSDIYKNNTKIELRIQHAVKYPPVNKVLGTYTARELYKKRFSFKVLPEYIDDHPYSYYIRGTFYNASEGDTGPYFVSSDIFKLKK
ncbi:hypothetical protein B0O80DRAFT_456321 [Mortierella sp. GBAus27b]|nr:hypothetical protein BGX31_001141 [Mortierella sp. GBA43]KAI8351354.1 hypothetical protein B0O80DRAFT_456321 [Mortierella sp. GBAus27b]